MAWSISEIERVKAQYQSKPAAEIARALGKTVSAIHNKANVLGIRKIASAPFRAGRKQHTWKPIGTERVDKDGAIVRKVSDTGERETDWVPLHVHLWTQAHGPVPVGSVVFFKDKDKRNFELANLGCVTRTEWMNRHSVHNYPPEIQKVAQLIGALNRKVSRGEQH